VRPRIQHDSDLCPRRGQYRKETLIARFGADVLMPDLRHLSRHHWTLHKDYFLFTLIGDYLNVHRSPEMISDSMKLGAKDSFQP
jgi:hypothetical protein